MKSADIQALSEAYLSIYNSSLEEATGKDDAIAATLSARSARSSTATSSTTSKPTTTTPAETPKPASTTSSNPLMKDMPGRNQPELDSLRQAAAKATMAGPSKEAQALMSNRTKTILSGRSPLSRDPAARGGFDPRFDRKPGVFGPNKLKSGIEGQEKVQKMRREIGKAPGEAPKETPKQMSDFSAGGGEAKMKATGMTRAEVESLGKRNIAAKPTSAPKPSPTSSTSTTQPPKPTLGLSAAEKERIDKFRSLNTLQKLQQKSAIEKELASLPPEKRSEIMAYYNRKEEFEGHILNYLVSEGYADNNTNAFVIMKNMSEEWKQSIIDEI